MKSTDQDSPDLDMSAWRASIDRFDNEILNLISQRLALSEQVGKSKIRGGLPWRPAREAQLFARLVGRASATLSPESVERLWSTVIAQSLQAQGPAFLVVSRSLDILPTLARTFFGLLPTQMVDTDAEAIAKSAAEEGAIAIVPAPSDGVTWWTGLADMQTGGTNTPAVLAAMPRFASAAAPAAYAIAMAPRETSGNDSAWLVTKESHHDQTPQGTVLARHQGYCLVSYDAKAAPEHTPNQRPIGLFANPLKITD